MKVSDISLGRALVLEVRPKFEKDFGITLKPLQEVGLHAVGMDSGMLMSVGDSSWEIEGMDQRSQQQLKDLALDGLPKYAWIAAVFPKQGNKPAGNLVIEVRVFQQEYRWSETIDLGVDDKVVDMVQKKERVNNTIEDVIGWLTEEILVVDEKGSIRVLLSGSPDPLANLRNGFRLHGKKVAVDVIRGDDDRLSVNKIVWSRQNQSIDERRPVLLIKGQFRFVDQTVAGVFRGQARSELDQIVEQSGSYLGIWKKYNEIEKGIVFDRAREFGWFHYDKADPLPEGGWRFYLTHDEDFGKKIHGLLEDESMTLEAAVNAPSELTDRQGFRADEDDKSDKVSRKRNFSGIFSSFDIKKRTLDLRISDERFEDSSHPPEKGVIFCSLGGDMVRLERRENAMEKIVSATCPMPQLGLILEGKSVPQRRRSCPDPLSPAARQAFGGEPTHRQREALKVALETPDIALIQGPPGTGKTRVIAALQARLSELGDGTGTISGANLLTSYQHDAVENVANATLVFGLPAVKIGKKSFKHDENKGVDRWRMERAEAVRSKLANAIDLPVAVVLRKCVDLASAYLKAPVTKDESSVLLRMVRDLAGSHLSPDLAEELLVLEQKLRRPEMNLKKDDFDVEQALKSVRGLRTTVASFSDDGPRQTQKALRRLQELSVLTPVETEFLTKVSCWDITAEPDFLEELKEIQNVLIDRLSPNSLPVNFIAINSDVEAMLGHVIMALRDKVRISRGGADAVLYDYLDELENDPLNIKTSVEQYTAVLAATCQQAVGHHMAERKGEDTFFQTVVVDEAARANPLDLLIPMSLAKRRIILVGDHRQLPHILDHEIERDLNSDVSEKTREMLGTSLFERLFKQLKERELSDGIKRTVTLDRQYRMHPVLGTFVSDSFYGQGEGFESGGHADDFIHSLLRYNNAVAAWKNIPRAKGAEKKGRSKGRKAEAQWVTEEAKRIMEECPQYSVGVITFYAEQVNEIMRAMEPLGMSEQLEEGGYRIHKAWETGRSEKGVLHERLRVGTVDAFQGKEFDVVLLSMTRSNDLSGTDPGTLRKKFGHLIVVNRLCVAMSRQKRLLIVAGDTAMLEGEEAETAIPALVAFYDLCGGEYGIRI